MRRSTRFLCFAFTAAIVWAGAGSLLQQAPAESTKLSNPFGHDERAQRAGGKIYTKECAACHGARREGSSKAPPLNGKAVSEAPPGAIFWVLRNGSLKHGMPSFAHLPEAQRWQIITFLRGEGTGLAPKD